VERERHRGFTSPQRGEGNRDRAKPIQPKLNPL
jgi:hypothetical protein